MLLKKFSNLPMALNWISPIVKGVLGHGFLVICIKFLAALVGFSSVDKPDMMRYCGKNYTTYACLYPLVFGVYQL